MDRFMCIECKSTFTRNSDLRRHARKFHLQKLNQIVEVKSYPFNCEHCTKNFSHRRNLTMHLKKHTEINTPTNVQISEEKVGKKCPMCDFTGKFKCDFYNHFKTEHDINLQKEEIKFSSSHEFSVWLIKTEKESKTKFILEKGKTNYVCHRSGFYTSTSTGKRRLKLQGSKKINGYCPAGIKVSIDKNDGSHNVTYVKTHVGHEIESQSIFELFSTSEERRPLLEKKEKLIEKLQRAIYLVEGEVENEKQIAAVEKLLNLIEPTIRALRQELVAAPRQTKEPANKKIEPQRRLFSTRNTTSKKSRRFEKPSQDEQNSIAVTLLEKDASN